MFKVKNVFFIITAIYSFVGTACSRFETEPRSQIVNQRPDTRSPELTNNYIKNWGIISITLNDSISEPIDTCRNDDEYFFHFDGYFELNLNENKCEGEEEDVIAGNWELQQDKTILQITYNTGFISVFNIVELDNTDLIIDGNAYDNSGEYIGKRRFHLRALS
jgi:hypothetical protein